MIAVGVTPGLLEPPVEGVVPMVVDGALVLAPVVAGLLPDDEQPAMATTVT